MESCYIINQKMMYMEGQYDQYGKICTKVTQTDQDFLVDMPPLKILEESIRGIGFDLKGAIKAAKKLLGNINMCPIMVNPILKICVFSNKSAKNDDAMWFNPSHIRRTSSFYTKTNVEFSNGLIIKVPSRLSSFNTKLQTAEQLRNITIEFGLNPISIIMDPQKDPLIHK